VTTWYQNSQFRVQRGGHEAVSIGSSMQTRLTTEVLKRIVPTAWHDSLRRLLGPRQPRSANLRFDAFGAAQPNMPSPYEFQISHSNPLEELGAKYRPTKRLHNYLVYYWAHFRDIRHQVRSVLEIGLETDRSMRMWEEFFPRAEIIGVDIDPKCRNFEGDRRRVFIGDQSDQTFLERVSREVTHGFDVVIDDGSHLVRHQIASFEFLFPKMSSHGIYVIEDTGACVQDFNLATVNAMKKLVNSIMYWPRGFPPEKWTNLATFGDEARWIDSHIVGIAFYRWMVVILKGQNPQDNPFLIHSAEPSQSTRA